jgi:hypothetical protein
MYELDDISDKPSLMKYPLLRFSMSGVKSGTKTPSEETEREKGKEKGKEARGEEEAMKNIKLPNRTALVRWKNAWKYIVRFAKAQQDSHEARDLWCVCLEGEKKKK